MGLGDENLWERQLAIVAGGEERKRDGTVDRGGCREQGVKAVKGRERGGAARAGVEVAPCDDPFGKVQLAVEVGREKLVREAPRPVHYGSRRGG